MTASKSEDEPLFTLAQTRELQRLAVRRYSHHYDTSKFSIDAREEFLDTHYPAIPATPKQKRTKRVAKVLEIFGHEWVYDPLSLRWTSTRGDFVCVLPWNYGHAPTPNELRAIAEHIESPFDEVPADD